MQLKVKGDVVVRAAQRAEIRAQVDGFVSHLNVSEGDAVGFGNPVARLENDELTASLNQIEAEIADARFKKSEWSGVSRGTFRTAALDDTR